MTTTIAFVGPKGGQGTSTIAAATALVASTLVEVEISDGVPEDQRAIFGVTGDELAPHVWLDHAPTTAGLRIECQTGSTDSLRVAAMIDQRASISRVIDAGVFAARLPDACREAARSILAGVQLIDLDAEVSSNG